jgi:hypothetical protein
VLFVLTRRFCFVLPPGPGDRKGRGGWARSAGPSLWARGPEAPRPRAHPTALCSPVSCGVGRSGAGVQDTCCNALPCASGRGHLPSNAQKRKRDAQDTRAPHVPPRPPSRQSTGLSAIHRFSRSAMPFSDYLPFFQHRRGDPWSPPEGASCGGGAPSAWGLPSCLARSHRLRDASVVRRQSARRLFVRREHGNEAVLSQGLSVFFARLASTPLAGMRECVTPRRNSRPRR